MGAKISQNIREPINSMLNYTYIFYSKNNKPTEEDYENFYNIILKYHYPICLNNKNILKDDEIENIRNNEISFIIKKIKEANNTYDVSVIPRIIYDLLNILCQIKSKDLKFIHYKIDRDYIYTQYNELCDIIHKIHIDIKPQTFILNNYIIDYINKVHTDNYTYKEWSLLLNTIIDEIQDAISDKIFLDQPIIKKYAKIFDEVDKLMADVKDYGNRYILLHKGMINNTRFKQYVKIFEAVLLKELNNDHIMQGKTILYRSSNNNNERPVAASSLWGPVLEDQGFSNSYNCSILSGVFFDRDACTYALMTHTINPSKHKLRYILSRFFMSDKSGNNDLFYIPPFHPFVQLYLSGEYFHPRSKIFKDSVITDIKSFAGYYQRWSYKEVPSKFPDYLMSKLDKETFVNAFMNTIDQREEITQADETAAGKLVLSEPERISAAAASNPGGYNPYTWFHHCY